MNLLIVVHERAGGPLAAAVRAHIAGSRVLHAKGIDEALARLRAIRFDALLVEPATGGFERLQAGAPDAALVALVRASDEAAGVAALSQGAVDYALYADLRTARLARLVRAAVERHRAARADEERRRRDRQAPGIAHYFNNLFAIQLGYGRRRERPRDLDRALLEHAMSHATGPEAPQDVNTVMRELAPSLQEVLGPRIELALELSPDAARVVVERLSLEQSVLAAVLNARDSVRGTGRVTIATHLARPHVQISVARPPRAVNG